MGSLAAACRAKRIHLSVTHLVEPLGGKSAGDLLADVRTQVSTLLPDLELSDRLEDADIVVRVVARTDISEPPEVEYECALLVWARGYGTTPRDSGPVFAVLQRGESIDDASSAVIAAFAREFKKGIVGGAFPN